VATAIRFRGTANAHKETHVHGECLKSGGSAVFDFRLGRGRDGPKRFLRQFEGILQTDGYSAYDQVGGPNMVHAACWAHARRQFFEVVQLNPRDPVATPIVAQMDELFAIDAEARRKGLTIAARHVRRQETAKNLLDDIRSKIEVAQSVALPSSALSKACQYALTLWKKLTHFLEYPELGLSTNLAENSMRPGPGSQLCSLPDYVHPSREEVHDSAD
jgi:transposase